MSNSIEIFHIRLSTFLLNLCIIIGWITSCIPSQIPLTTNWNCLAFQIGKKFIRYLGLLISVAFLIVQIIFIIDLTLREQIYLSKNTTPPSEYVIEFTEYIFLHLCDVIKPVLWIISYPKLLNIIQKLLKLNKDKQISPCKIPYYFLWLVFLSILLLSITPVLFSIAFSFGSGSGIAILPAGMPQHVIWLLRDLSSFGSAILSKGFILLIGENLVRHYEFQVQEFIKSCTSDNNGGALLGKNIAAPSITHTFPIAVLNKRQQQQLAVDNGGYNNNTKKWKEHMDKFEEIRILFEMYGSIAGIKTAISLSKSIAMIISWLGRSLDVIQDNQFGVEASVVGLPTIILALSDELLNIFLCSHFGEIIKIKMESSKTLLETLLLQMSISPQVFENQSKEQITALGNYLLKWNWNLSAAGLVNVNHGTLPAVAASLLAVLMFIFQLKLSEAK